MIRRLLRLSAFCALLVGAADAAATGCQSAQSVELKGQNGLLAMNIDAGSQISAIKIDRVGSLFGGATITGLQGGTNVCLIELEAGEYRWSRVDLAFGLFLRVGDDVRFRFRIAPGVINYVGDFSLFPAGFISYHMNVDNRSARMLAQLDRVFPGVRRKYPLQYQGAFPDRFLQFAVGELGEQSAADALDAGEKAALKDPGKNAPPELRALVDELFAKPQVRSVHLNSAGDLIAMIEYRDKKHRIALFDPQSHVAVDVYRGDVSVRRMLFVDDRTLAFELNLNGGGNHVVRVERKPDAAPAFSQFEIPGRGWFLEGLAQGGPHAVYARMDADGAAHMFRIDLGGRRLDTSQFAGALRLDKGLDKVLGGLVDSSGTLRVAMTSVEGDYALMYRPDDKSAWHEVRRITADEQFEPVLLSADGASLVALSNRDRPERDLVRIALPSGEVSETLYSIPGVDLEGVLARDADRKVLGVTAYRDGQYETRYIDAPDEAVRKAVARVLPGKSIAIYDTSADGKRMLILASDETEPGTFYFFDAASRTLQELEPMLPPMPHLKAVRSQVVHAVAADATPLESYLTLPRAGAAPFPLVVVPHGGPIGMRDTLDFDPEVQLLAARGYAVLRVNYRGSGGFGRAFEQSGFGAWGKSIEDDVLAAIDAALKSAPLDPERIALRGASYGGYSTLMGLIRSPERFRCGVAASAVSDIPLMFTSSDWSHDERSRQQMVRIVGDPGKALSDMEAVSPDYLYRKLDRPLLLIHGGADRRVTSEHALRLLMLLAHAQKPPQLLYFPDEGHGISGLEDRFAAEAAVDRFLGECLKPAHASAQAAAP